MSSPIDDQVALAAAQLREQGERIRTFQQQQAQATTTVVSKDRLVTATVSGKGRLTELTFKGNKYRMMSPAELGNAVLETVNAALEQASAQSMAAAMALMPPGLAKTGFTTDGEIDIEALLKRTAERAGTSFFFPADQQTPGDR